MNEPTIEGVIKRIVAWGLDPKLANALRAIAARHERERQALEAELSDLKAANEELFRDAERYWALLDDPEIAAKDDLFKRIEEQEKLDRRKAKARALGIGQDEGMKS